MTAEDERAPRTPGSASPDERPVALFIGALGDRRKGFDRAVRRVAHAVPRRGVGRRSARRRARARSWTPGARARRDRGPGRPDPLSRLPHRHSRVLAAADVLVHPARYEAYGLGVHEAVCRGVPAIVHRHAGVAERYPPSLGSLVIAESADAPTRSPTVCAAGAATARPWRARVAPLAARLRARSWDDMAADIVAGGGGGMTRRVRRSTPRPTCWVCGGAELDRVHGAASSCRRTRAQDPALAAYSGQRVDLPRCRDCGFAQPAALPALPRVLRSDVRPALVRRMDRGRASTAAYKDAIFADILAALGAAAAADAPARCSTSARTRAGSSLARAARLGRRRARAEPEDRRVRRARAPARRCTRATSTRSMPTRALRRGDADRRARAHSAIRSTCFDRVRALLCAAAAGSRSRCPTARRSGSRSSARAAASAATAPTLADNLVHVNHFSAASLRPRARGAPAFATSRSSPARRSCPAATRVRRDRLGRLAVYRLARALPAAPHSPLAFNLQAYGRR